MDLWLTECNGLPERPIISINSKATRQTLLTGPCETPLHVRHAPWPLRIDLYSRAAKSIGQTSLSNLDQNGCCTVQFEAIAGQAASVTFRVEKNANSEGNEREELDSSVNIYCQNHGINAFMRENFDLLLAERPDDPYEFLARRFHEAAARESGRPMIEQESVPWRPMIEQASTSSKSLPTIEEDSTSSKSLPILLGSLQDHDGLESARKPVRQRAGMVLESAANDGRLEQALQRDFASTLPTTSSEYLEQPSPCRATCIKHESSKTTAPLDMSLPPIDEGIESPSPCKELPYRGQSPELENIAPTTFKACRPGATDSSSGMMAKAAHSEAVTPILRARKLLSEASSTKLKSILTKAQSVTPKQRAKKLLLEADGPFLMNALTASTKAEHLKTKHGAIDEEAPEQQKACNPLPAPEEKAHSLSPKQRAKNLLEEAGESGILNALNKARSVSPKQRAKHVLLSAGESDVLNALTTPSKASNDAVKHRALGEEIPEQQKACKPLAEVPEQLKACNTSTMPECQEQTISPKARAKSLLLEAGELDLSNALSKVQSVSPKQRAKKVLLEADEPGVLNALDKARSQRTLDEDAPEQQKACKPLAEIPEQQKACNPLPMPEHQAQPLGGVAEQPPMSHGLGFKPDIVGVSDGMMAKATVSQVAAPRLRARKLLSEASSTKLKSLLSKAQSVTPKQRAKKILEEADESAVLGVLVASNEGKSGMLNEDTPANEKSAPPVQPEHNERKPDNEVTPGNEKSAPPVQPEHNERKPDEEALTESKAWNPLLLQPEEDQLSKGQAPMQQQTEVQQTALDENSREALDEAAMEAVLRIKAAERHLAAEKATAERFVREMQLGGVSGGEADEAALEALARIYEAEKHLAAEKAAAEQLLTGQAAVKVLTPQQQNEISEIAKRSEAERQAAQSEIKRLEAEERETAMRLAADQAAAEEAKRREAEEREIALRLTAAEQTATNEREAARLAAEQAAAEEAMRKAAEEREAAIRLVAAEQEREKEITMRLAAERAAADEARRREAEARQRESEAKEREAALRLTAEQPAPLVARRRGEEEEESMRSDGMTLKATRFAPDEPMVMKPAAESQEHEFVVPPRMTPNRARSTEAVEKTMTASLDKFEADMRAAEEKLAKILQGQKLDNGLVEGSFAILTQEKAEADMRAAEEKFASILESNKINQVGHAEASMLDNTNNLESMHSSFGFQHPFFEPLSLQASLPDHTNNLESVHPIFVDPFVDPFIDPFVDPLSLQAMLVHSPTMSQFCPSSFWNGEIDNIVDDETPRLTQFVPNLVGDAVLKDDVLSMSRPTSCKNVSTPRLTQCVPTHIGDYDGLGDFDLLHLVPTPHSADNARQIGTPGLQHLIPDTPPSSTPRQVDMSDFIPIVGGGSAISTAHSLDLAHLIPEEQNFWNKDDGLAINHTPRLSNFMPQ